MSTMLIIFGSIAVIELMTLLIPRSFLQRTIALAVSFGLLVSGILLLRISLQPWTVLVAVLSIYRMTNMFRVRRNNGERYFMMTRIRTASLWLIASQLVLYLVAHAWAEIHNARLMGILVLTSQLLLTAGLWIFTHAHIKQSNSYIAAEPIGDHQLPSISIVIPARNETDDLKDCLDSLIHSDYPKMEILVLDDCSQNKHTPETIRSYAHEGVRFIAGTPPPADWLPKNHAYQQLVTAASGQYILFCGVDIQFSPASVRTLIETIVHTKKSMLCVVPQNRLHKNHPLLSQLLQPARYGWEISWPRRAVVNPPCLSSCWLIDRSQLLSSGGFKAVARMIVPERYFARQAARDSGGYLFISSEARLGVQSSKAVSEQFSTAVRVRYPQLHQRLEMVALISFADFYLLLGPYLLLAYYIYQNNVFSVALCALNCVVLMWWYFSVVRWSYSAARGAALLLEPWAALLDIFIMNYSFYRYEFKQVLWKGRNVCEPVMYSQNKLPPV